jgi:hypothetical protein
MSTLPPPQTVNDFYAAALLDALNGIRTMLDDRLPPLAPNREPVAPAAPAADHTEPEPIPIREPAPARTPRKATTRKAGR